MPWFYLSFVSPEDVFLGACVVEAPDSTFAPLVAHTHGCNPGGQALVLHTPDNTPGPLAPYKLLSKAELGDGMTLGELRDCGAIPPEDAAIVCEHVNPPPTWPRNYDRSAVLASIEDATGTSLSANDPLPDSLIANAQALGLIPAELRMWIHDEPKRGDWSLAALRAWAAKYELGIAAEEKTAE
jgi:hypothetical protein